MIDFQPLHQLPNGSLQNPFFWKQKYSSTMWRMTSSSLPIFRFFFNLTREERLALRSLKSSKILLEFKIKVLRLLSSVNKILRQLNNDLHYDSLDSDPTLDHFEVVKEWSRECSLRGRLVRRLPRGVFKTHKHDNPLWLITFCCGTAIEQLSAFTEFYLKPLSQSPPSFVKDSTDFINKLEDLNGKGWGWGCAKWNNGDRLALSV